MRPVTAKPAAMRPGLRRRLRHLPAGLVASAAVAALGVVVGAVVGGAAAAAGALAGVALVAASYTVSSVVIAWADSIDPRLIMPVGLMTYVFKFTVIGLVMWVIAGTAWSGLKPMGVTIMVTALGWTIAQAWWTWHARIAYVELD